MPAILKDKERAIRLTRTTYDGKKRTVTLGDVGADFAEAGSGLDTIVQALQPAYEGDAINPVKVVTTQTYDVELD